MNRRSVFALASLVAGGATASQAQPDDATAIRALLDEYAAAWNAGDAARMFALATPDIHWVNVVGVHWQGKAQAELAHKIALETMFRGVPLKLLAVDSVTPVGDDVLAVVARWSKGAFTPPGAPAEVPASEDRMSLILQRTAAGLKIAHGANVTIDPMAVANDPATKPPGR